MRKLLLLGLGAALTIMPVLTVVACAKNVEEIPDPDPDPVKKDLKITTETLNPKDLYTKAGILLMTLKPGLVIDGNMDQTTDVNWIFKINNVDGWNGVKVKAETDPIATHEIIFTFEKDGYLKLDIRFLPDEAPVLNELKITKDDLPQQELYTKAGELHKTLRHGPVIDGDNDQTKHPHWMFNTQEEEGWNGVTVTAHHIMNTRNNPIHYEFEKEGCKKLTLEFLPETTPILKELKITKQTGTDIDLYKKAEGLLKTIKPGLIIEGEMNQTTDANWMFDTKEADGWNGVKVKVEIEATTKDVILYTFEKEGYEKLVIKFLPVEIPVLKELKITKQTGTDFDLYKKAEGLFKTIKPGLIIEGEMNQTTDANWMFDTKEADGWNGITINKFIIPNETDLNIIEFEFGKEGYEKLFIRFLPDKTPILKELKITPKNLTNIELFLKAGILYNAIEPGLVINGDQDLTTQDNWIFETTEPDGWAGITIKMTYINDATLLGAIKYTFEKEGYDPLNIFFWADKHLIE
jgi:hypothetical protein